MDYLYIGKYVNTHGIKGEIRIVFDTIILNLEDYSIVKQENLLPQLFKKDNSIYLGKEKQEFIIESYRHHKIYEMLTFKNITNIDEIIFYKGSKCYINKLTLNHNYILLDELINYNVYFNNNEIGKIVDYQNNFGNILFIVKKEKNYYIPINSNFIELIDFNNKCIKMKNLEGLI